MSVHVKEVFWPFFLSGFSLTPSFAGEVEWQSPFFVIWCACTKASLLMCTAGWLHTCGQHTKFFPAAEDLPCSQICDCPKKHADGQLKFRQALLIGLFYFLHFVLFCSVLFCSVRGVGFFLFACLVLLFFRGFLFNFVFCFVFFARTSQKCERE